MSRAARSTAAPFAESALGVLVDEQHALTETGAVIAPQFYSARPSYVPSPRTTESVGFGAPTRNYPMGAPIAVGSIAELAAGTAVPMYLRHYHLPPRGAQ